MANAINTNGTHERRETWAQTLLAIARLETNIYEDFSTDYEVDEVTGIIHVPTRNQDVTLSDYDVLEGIELTQSQTSYIQLIPDQHYAFNELIDGYEAEAVPDNLVAQRLESAGLTVGYRKENLAITTLVAQGTVSSDTAALTKATVYEKIAKEVSNMKKRGMKVANMRIVISADVELLLLTDDKFANTSGTLGENLIREGVIGKINGVATKPNYLMPADVDFIVYDTRFIQKYEIWKSNPGIYPINNGKHVGASALQGRQVGGVKVTNALGVQIKKGPGA